MNDTEGQEKKWGDICKGLEYITENQLSVDLDRVGASPYLDGGTLMCLTCDMDGNALISVDEILESAIHFRTLPIYTGKAHGMWFNVSQMKALKHVLEVVIENSEEA